MTTPRTPSPHTAPTLPLDDAERARLVATASSHFPALVADLEDLVRIPSVSAPAFDQQHVRESAEAVATLLRDAGLSETEIVSVPGGAPAVLAHHDAGPDAPHVVLYAHHDVQPPGEGWSTAAFTPTRVGDRLYGRGAADDKAGVMVHVGAVRALREACGELPLSVTVFVEGEEEIGSPTFGAFLQAYGDRVAGDVIVVADSANWKVGVPALTTSLRGLVDLVVTVDVLDHPVHSGMFGGPVLDAVTSLARLLATLHDADGAVAVEGLVHGRAADLDYPEQMFREEAGVLEGVELAGRGSVQDRLWAQPALAVIGIDAPTVALASNTLAHTARAKISLRLAPGQDPLAAQEALTAHLLAHAPFGARVGVEPGERGNAFAAGAGTPAMDLARAAFAAAWGVAPVDLGMGGSIPFIADLLALAPEAEILITGVEDPASRAHSADESVHLGELEHALVAEVLLLASLAR